MTDTPATTPRAELDARLETLARTPAYRAYERARDAVLRMYELAGPATTSSYWRDELAGFEYMLDASPLLVDKLRHQTYHVTGLKVYDYRAGKEAMGERLAAKRRMLLEHGDADLLVPEARELGGFGFEIDGELYNVDTLKFFEVMIALDHGAVLPKLREPGERRAVWEIGAGWGGFARVFKTVVPNTTYFIVDLPELFLFSGPYLQTLFPDAAIRYWDGESAEELMRGWESADFVMVPAGALEHFRPPRLDLALNMVSFQEMTTEQVRGYVHHAADLGTPFLYSLNRQRSLYNTELTSTTEIMSERYRLHDIPVLDLPYTKMPVLGRAAKLRRPGRPGTNEYKHHVGWLRAS